MSVSTSFHFGIAVVCLYFVAGIILLVRKVELVKVLFSNVTACNLQGTNFIIRKSSQKHYDEDDKVRKLLLKKRVGQKPEDKESKWQFNWSFDQVIVVAAAVVIPLVWVAFSRQEWLQAKNDNKLSWGLKYDQKEGTGLISS